MATPDPPAPSLLAHELQDRARTLAGLAELEPPDRATEYRRQSTRQIGEDYVNDVTHSAEYMAIVQAHGLTDAERVRKLAEVVEALALRKANEALGYPDGMGAVPVGPGRYQVPPRRPDTGLRGVSYDDQGAPVQRSGGGNTPAGGRWNPQAHRAELPGHVPDPWARYEDHQPDRLAEITAAAAQRDRMVFSEPRYSRCGHANEAAAKFCVTCGAPIVKVQVDAPAAASEEPGDEQLHP